jgi:hypothetical protein
MKNKFPPGWDEERVRKVIAHYEQQTEEKVVAEDTLQTKVASPLELIEEVTK